MDEHEADAGAVQQAQIVRERHEPPLGDELAPESDDERPAAKRVEVRRDGAKPGDEGCVRPCGHGVFG